MGQTATKEIALSPGKCRRLTDDERGELYFATNYTWIVTETYVYDDNQNLIMVPTGFLADGATMAPDIKSASWVVHDYLYATHEFEGNPPCTREEADQVMTNILIHENYNIFGWLFSMVSYINPFKLFAKAWEISGKRGPEFAQDYNPANNDL